MGIFRRECPACAAKDQTIAFLREQLESARQREEKASESMIALADTVAHARLYPRQKDQQTAKEREAPLPSWRDAQNDVPSFASLMPGVSQGKLEEMFTHGRKGMTSNMGVPDVVKTS